MRRSNPYAYISAVAGVVPEDILSNQDLEKMVDTTDDWITSRTGIKKRHIIKGPGKGISHIAIPTVEQLCAKAKIDPEEIDLLICATVTGDLIFPATANIICGAIGAKNAFGFDLAAACSGFLYALTTGAQFIESGNCKKVVVVGADKMSSIVDYTDRQTCVIFGDASAAVLLESTQDEIGIIDSLLKADGTGERFLHQKAGGSRNPPSYATIDNKEHCVYQEGRIVFKHAVTNMAQAVKDVMARNNLTKDDIAFLVPHQANKRILEAVADRLEFPKDQVMINIQDYGNTTSATIPLCLRDWESKLKKGDNLILTSFGGGFTWGATYVKWGYDQS